MTPDRISDVAKSASYNSSNRALIVQFLDGSTLSIPVHLLEMVRYDGSEWVSVEPSDENSLKLLKSVIMAIALSGMTSASAIALATSSKVYTVGKLGWTACERR